ncbi:MAG: hypothetical protein JO208_02715 [Alphaproteobacteria bacterium]|nr:hypothetical protein [Alphaproteobacteria bacterium]
MPALTNLTSKIARSEGDPKIISTGPGSLSGADRLGKALGWFSFGLGLAEMIAPKTITRALGMEGKETLVRAYGAREIGAGMLCLSIDKPMGLWNRVAGDGVDIATLLTGMRSSNPKRDNVMIALAVVLGVTALDILAAQATTTRHSRNSAEPRRYADRSGYPKGIQHSRGAAKEMAHAFLPTSVPALTQATATQGTA